MAILGTPSVKQIYEFVVSDYEYEACCIFASHGSHYVHDIWLLLYRSLQILEPRFSFIDLDGYNGYLGLYYSQEDYLTDEAISHYRDNNIEYTDHFLQVIVGTSILETNYARAKQYKNDFYDYYDFWTSRRPKVEYLQPLIEGNVDHNELFSKNAVRESRPSPAVFMRLACKILRQFYDYYGIDKSVPETPDIDDSEVWKVFGPQSLWS